MEKKNTILLTVIAVATLLVAVVGATFAYFTANVTTEGLENGANKTTVTTRSIASATMTLGSNISSEDVSNVLPGFQAFRTIDIVSPAQEGAQALTATITLTPTNTTAFGTHIKYSIYKVATASKPDDSAVCTASDPKTPGENGHYYDAMTCAKTGLTQVVASTTLDKVVNQDIVINPGAEETYYVFVEYENAAGQQDAEQGQNFSVEISFAAKA